MKFEIFYKTTALKDLEDISVFLFEKTGFANFAKDYINSIKSQIEILGFYPEMGFWVDDVGLLSQDFRGLVLGNYVVYYKYDGKRIVIFHIWYSKKSFPNLNE
ncbi:type II toxin-antitoxin system RelE/ParE family toxin [Patescibacteria group bacterium]|nr:type II toxin-antitoxin system RelE/ParE family toxin [Patescibacteria group bacterium]